MEQNSITYSQAAHKFILYDYISYCLALFVVILVPTIVTFWDCTIWYKAAMSVALIVFCILFIYTKNKTNEWCEKLKNCDKE